MTTTEPVPDIAALLALAEEAARAAGRLVVDGRPNVRACVTAAREEMDVRVQNGSAGDVYGIRD